MKTHSVYGLTASGAAFMLLTLQPQAAKALVIDVGGEQWSIGSVFSTFVDNQSLLESQPWFTNDGGVLAAAFASALNTQPPFTDINGFNGGLFFAWGTFPSPSGGDITRNPELGVTAKFWKSVSDPCNGNAGGGGACSVFPDAGTVAFGSGDPIPANWNYATATRVPASVPAPLPVFGALAAFGCSRRLRMRINHSKNPVSPSSSI